MVTFLFIVQVALTALVIGLLVLLARGAWVRRPQDRAPLVAYSLPALWGGLALTMACGLLILIMAPLGLDARWAHVAVWVVRGVFVGIFTWGLLTHAALVHGPAVVRDHERFSIAFIAAVSTVYTGLLLMAFILHAPEAAVVSEGGGRLQFDAYSRDVLQAFEPVVIGTGPVIAALLIGAGAVGERPVPERRRAAALSFALLLWVFVPITAGVLGHRDADWYPLTIAIPGLAAAGLLLRMDPSPTHSPG